MTSQPWSLMTSKLPAAASLAKGRRVGVFAPVRGRAGKAVPAGLDSNGGAGSDMSPAPSPLRTPGDL